MPRVTIDGRFRRRVPEPVPVRVSLSVSLDEDPEYATAIVDLELEFPHGPVTARALTGRRYLPRFAVALRQLIAAVDDDTAAPRDYDSYLLSKTGEVALSDWDALTLLTFCCAEGGDKVAMNGLFRQYMSGPLTRDRGLAEVVSLWRLVVGFQGIEISRQDVLRIAEMVEGFVQEYPLPGDEPGSCSFGGGRE